MPRDDALLAALRRHHPDRFGGGAEAQSEAEAQTLPIFTPENRRNLVAPVLNLIRRASMISGIAVADIIGPCRAMHLVRIRSAIVHVARHVTNHSYPMIAQLMNRDHSTIITAERRALQLIERDPAFSAFCHRLGKEIYMPEVAAIFEGIDVPVCRPENPVGGSSRTPGLSWAVVGKSIYLMIADENGAALAAQLDEHELHALASDLAAKIAALPPRPESERALQ